MDDGGREGGGMGADSPSNVGFTLYLFQDNKFRAMPLESRSFSLERAEGEPVAI